MWCPRIIVDFNLLHFAEANINDNDDDDDLDEQARDMSVLHYFLLGNKTGHQLI